jgi:hypothetical protein
MPHQGPSRHRLANRSSDFAFDLSWSSWFSKSGLVPGLRGQWLGTNGGLFCKEVSRTVLLCWNSARVLPSTLSKPEVGSSHIVNPGMIFKTQLPHQTTGFILYLYPSEMCVLEWVFNSLFLSFWQYWSLNSGLHSCKAGTLLLEPCLQPSKFL